MSTTTNQTPGQLAMLACAIEVLSPKAGNVHPQADFDDATCGDFLASALAIRPVFDRAGELGVGDLVLEAVRATKRAAGSNTNLGMILLLAPLAAASSTGELRAGVHEVLGELTEDDASAVYEAIRLAQPGGLGRAEKADVSERPTVGLVEAMQLAADRDLIARQYANGFADVFDRVGPRLREAYVDRALPLDVAVTVAHLQLMAAEPDSLILRKCGRAVAAESMARADAVLQAGYPDTRSGADAFEALDAWLRQSDDDCNHDRNPGTSADLVCAGLYVMMRDGMVPQPWRWEGSLLPLAGDWLMQQ